MSGRGNDRPKLGRLYSLGIELAAAVAGFTLLGYWIDRHFATSPLWTLICLGLGMFGGMYNFVRGALKESRTTSAPEAKGTDGPEGA